MAKPNCPSYHTPMMVSASRRDLMKNIRFYLRRNPDVVALAGSGISGIPLVAIACHEFGLEPIYVRRQEENCHDWRQSPSVCTSLGSVNLAGRYAIVDDLIESGTTARWIEDAITEFGIFRESVPKAALLYRSVAEGALVMHYPCYYIGADETHIKYAYANRKKLEKEKAKKISKQLDYPVVIG